MKKLVYGKWQKSLRVMRIVAIILLVGCMQVSAKGVAQGITLSEKDAHLGKVLDKIEKQMDYAYRFWYTEMIMSKANRVNINVKNISFEEVLKILFENQPLKFKIVDKKMVVLMVKEERTSVVERPGEVGDPIDVKGKVVNENGEPVAGVTVTVKETKASTNTDENGDFTLSAVDGDAVLVFTHMSMEAVEEKLGKRREVVVKMGIGFTNLKGVFKTGYQEISGEKSIGVYGKLDSASYHRRAGMNIIDRLDGTVPGVVFNKKGYSSQFAIQVRGISTLGILNTATYPLIVIDNFQMDERFDINSINPNDVESITILKDAVATSMYGTRGANGVIVIAMKKGRFNQPLRVSVSSMITIEEKPDLFYFPQITPSDFIGIEEYLFNNGYYDSYLNDLVSYPEISTAVEIMARRRAGLISETDAKSQIDNLRKFDLRKELKKNVYRNAARQQHYLSFGGGTNNLSYQISFGYNHNLNNIQGSRPMDQYTFASSANFKPVKNLEIQVSLQLSRSKDRSYTFNLPSSASPYDRLADENGNALAISNAFRKEYLDTVGGGSLMNWSYRPLDEIHLADNERVSNFSRLSLGLIYNLTPWLNTAVNFGFTTTNTNIRNYLSMEAWEARNLINLYTNFTETDPNLRYPIPKEGILDLNNDLSLRYDLRGTINLNKTWRNQHQLTALLGAEISEANGYGNGQRLYGYNRNNGTYRTDIDYYNYYPLSYIYAGYTNGIPSSNYFREQPFNRFVSILGNASYSFNDKYYLYASARRDGANIFGVNTNNRWKPLWSVGASWYLSKEDFFELNWIQSLKIRASYGYTGNVNNQLSGKYTIIYGTPAQFTNLPAASNGDAFNPDLKWEEVRIFNVGLDFAILKNKISGSIDLFQKRSKDVLANLPLDPTVGINVYPVNYASLNTKGFDVLLSSKNNIGALEWTTSFGFSYAKSVVSEVYNRFGYRANDFTSFSLNATPGQIAFGLSSFKWGGLDPATGDPIGFLNGVASTDYSAILMDSIQHQLFHGSQIPLYSGFIRNNFSWKGISLSMNITGRFNFYFRQPALNLEYSSVIGSNNYMYDYYIRWQKPGDELVTTVPSMIYPASSATSLRNAFYKYAEIHVRRGDNIRIQDIRLAYQCINKRKSKLPIKDAQFFVYPNNLNLIIWRAEKTYFDPDFSGVATDATAAPTPKTWTVGVMVSL